MCLTLAALALLPCDARADSYGNPVYGGTGSVTATGAAPAPYASRNGGWGATNSTQGGTAQSTGSITTSFTWSGPSQPPQSVIVTETCNDSASGTSDSPQNHPPSASCSDLGDTGTQAPPVYEPAPPATPYAETLQTTLLGTRYSAESGSNPLTLTDAPSASATGNPGTATATVGYMATASAVTMQLTGTTPDGSGNQDILVGQQCTASLQCGAAGTFSNWQWSVSDSSNTFQSWSTTTPAIPPAPANPNASHYVPGPGMLTIASPSWYWDEPMATTATVTCTATFTPPTGQGSPMTVTATQMVNVYVPTWTATGTGGQMCISLGGTGWALIAVPTVAGVIGGMAFNLSVTTPPSPAFGTGTLAMIQIISSPFQSYQWSATDYKHLWSDNSKPGLDSNTFYPLVSPNTKGTTYAASTNDNPGIILTLPDGTDPFYWASDQNGFTDTLMYLPPAPASSPKSATMYVPLASFSWSISGSATIPMDMKWSDYAAQHNNSSSAGTVTPSGSPGGNFNPTNTFPMWTKFDLNSDPYS